MNSPYAMPEGWAGWTQAARDAAYDNLAGVADSAAQVANRNTLSVAFRAAHAGHLDLPFGAGEREKWDLYPAARADAPCLVFIHGGYWQRNRREDFAIMAEGALAAGWSVGICGYTLAPDASMNKIVAEIHAALDWLGAHGKAHGIAGK
ncbi:MAG: alpha/beta hydrolase, partial [Acetobacteraceae bacterium]|nr:alpha/beta hydrolase [Acetobacteraceae bacterium]